MSSEDQKKFEEKKINELSSKDGNENKSISEPDNENEKQVTDPVKLAKVLKMLEKLQLQNGEIIPTEYLNKLKEKSGLELEKIHEFWKTQPVPQKELTPDVKPGAIHEDLPSDKISIANIPLPKEFEWVDVDLDNQEDMEALYNLLKFNYNEDSDGMFRFDYSIEFLKWALKPPGFKKTWHTGVRVVATKKLVAFISAIPVHLKVLDNEKSMVEINFLCVHKKLRSKRLAPVLIKEVTRRVHLQGIFQAVYTAGIKIPSPVAVCAYYHRTLNPKKLIEVGFSGLGNMTMQQRIKHDSVPSKAPLKLRLMEEKDLPQVQALYNKFQASNSKFTPLYTKEEDAKHWLLPLNNVLWTYVVDGEDGKITDFASFYRLDSSVLQHSEHSKIEAAYLYYYGTTAKDNLSKEDELNPEKNQAYVSRLRDLFQSILIMANKLGFDVVNGLDCFEGHHFYKHLGFSKGDGSLHYYLYNWQCPKLENPDIGLIMV